MKKKRLRAFYFVKFLSVTHGFKRWYANMREIVGKAYTELGRELTEARDRLASHNKYEGVFERWYTTIGWKKEQVYRLIRRYNLVTNCDEVQSEILEDLPVIAKPSADSTPAKTQAKAEVLARLLGDNKM